MDALRAAVKNLKTERPYACQSFITYSQDPNLGVAGWIAEYPSAAQQLLGEFRAVIVQILQESDQK